MNFTYRVKDPQWQKTWDRGWGFISVVGLNWLVYKASKMAKEPQQPENYIPNSSEICKAMSGSRLLLNISYRQKSVTRFRCYIQMQIFSKTSRKSFCQQGINLTLEDMGAACPFPGGYCLSTLAQVTLMFCLALVFHSLVFLFAVPFLTFLAYICCTWLRPSVAINLFLFWQSISLWGKTQHPYRIHCSPYINSFYYGFSERQWWHYQTSKVPTSMPVIPKKSS